MTRIIQILIITAMLTLPITAECKDLAGQTNEPNDSELVDAASGPNKPADDYISGDAFNSGFAQLLNIYVNENRMVNYAKLRRMRLELNQQMQRLRDLKPEIYMNWAREDKIAFWINAYNCCTLSGIIQNYPIQPSRFKLLFYPPNSIMHISGLKNEMYFDIMGLQYTINEIEREILLGKFKEPRSCFATCTGTLSSARLRKEPYMGKTLNDQLESQTKGFFARDDAFQINTSAKTVKLTGIFKMYSWRAEIFVELFGDKKLFREYPQPQRAFLTFLSEYISEANADILKRSEYDVEHIKYNWALNEAPDK